jgi:hypothetical protein
MYSEKARLLFLSKRNITELELGACVGLKEDIIEKRGEGYETLKQRTL